MKELGGAVVRPGGLGVAAELGRHDLAGGSSARNHSVALNAPTRLLAPRLDSSS
jgi:hypothetical protein